MTADLARGGDPVALPAGVAAAVDHLVTRGETTAVVQIAGCLRGRCFAWVHGNDIWGSPASVATMHNVFCSAKPFLAAKVIAVLEAADIGLTTPAAALVGPAGAWVPGSVTVGEVLRHQAGVLVPDALTWRLHRPEDRHDLFSVGHWDGPAGDYSSLAGWMVLEEIVAHLSGDEPSSALQHAVEVDWRLPDTYVRLEESQARRERQRLSAALTFTPRGVVPLLSEVLPRYVAQARAAFGCFASAAGLARFYELAGRALAGEPVPSMPSRGALRAGWIDGAVTRDDRTFGRRSTFSLGVMRDLHLRFGSGRLSADTFGHTGGFCTSVGLNDPNLDLALAVVLGIALFDQGAYDQAIGVAVDAVFDHLGC